MKQIWETLQSYLDISGDSMLCIFTICVIVKLMRSGLNMADAAAYGTAVSAFTVNNTWGKK